MAGLSPLSYYYKTSAAQLLLPGLWTRFGTEQKMEGQRVALLFSNHATTTAGGYIDIYNECAIKMGQK